MTKGNRNNHYIEFTTKDHELLASIKLLLNSEHKISLSHPTDSNKCYRLQIGSKQIYTDLVRLGFVPRKSIRLKLPLIPNKYLSHFIRGYFDGDGHVWVGPPHSKRRTQGITLSVGFTSGSRTFLESLNTILRHKLGISTSIIFHENAYRLVYSVLPSLSLYKFMYTNATIYLPRKKTKFEHYIALRA